MAKDIEPCHPPPLPAAKKPFVPYNSYYQKTVGVQTKPPPTPPTIQQQVLAKQTEFLRPNAQRIRKVGECWRCGDKWMYGHKCKLIPNVHLLQQEVEETN